MAFRLTASPGNSFNRGEGSPVRSPCSSFTQGRARGKACNSCREKHDEVIQQQPWLIFRPLSPAVARRLDFGGGTHSRLGLLPGGYSVADAFAITRKTMEAARLIVRPTMSVALCPAGEDDLEAVTALLGHLVINVF